jgi:DNA-binding response OmpR family regulator
MLLKKIVVAEDDDAIAHMVNMALGDAGFLCLRARDGEEALRLVRAHDPDLLVLDVMMPRVDGYEVARRLKSDVMWSRTPILMLTALAGTENQVEGLEAGADAYMTKPFDLREFNAQVKALIRAARRERDRNPTTDLPGSRAIDAELEEVLKRGAAAVVHIDLAAFDAYADAVGFARAEETVRSLAKLIVDEARAVTSGGAFVGHIGGSDFIMVTMPAQAETLAAAVVAAFEAKRGAVAPGDDGARLALVCGVASTEDIGNGGIDELGRRLGKAMKAAKAAAKSGYVVWAPPK